jgi:hypothetical protein
MWDDNGAPILAHANGVPGAPGALGSIFAYDSTNGVSELIFAVTSLNARAARFRLSVRAPDDARRYAGLILAFSRN